MDLSLFLLSLLSSFGLAVLLVEKSDKWPVRTPVILLRKFIYKINKNAEQVFDCTVCMSFWTALLIDLVLLVFSSHFLWPVSGVATLGVTWVVYQSIDVIDSIRIAIESTKNNTSKAENDSD